MASEFEEAAEVAQDQIKEELLKEGMEHEAQWIGKVGLSTMIMALLVAVGALLASFTANELMLERTSEILEVSRLKGARLDIELLKSKHAILTALGESVDSLEFEKIRAFQEKAKILEAGAKDEEAKTLLTLFEHERFAIGVTLLSIALALSGIAVIVGSKKIWVIGIIAGLVGAGLLGVGIFNMML